MFDFTQIFDEIQNWETFSFIIQTPVTKTTTKRKINIKNLGKLFCLFGNVIKICEEGDVLLKKLIHICHTRAFFITIIIIYLFIYFS